MHNSMLIIDLGNTSASVAIFKGRKIASKGRLTYDNFPKSVHNFINSGRYTPSICVFCSVNPKFDSKLRDVLKRKYPKMTLFQLKNGDIPLKNRYKNKNQAGVDRLVNVFGAGKLYGFPCLAIDIGTAITFDIGGPDGSFEGGLIFAGPNLSFNALQKGTAKIGKFPFEFTFKKTLLGKSTRECVNQGLAFGYGNLIRGIIDEFRQFSKKKWKKNPKVIITGGYLNVIKPYLSKDDVCDEFLTLKAMARHQEEIS